MQKRKRQGQHVTISSGVEPSATPTVNPQASSRSFTYARSAQTGRLSGRQDTVDIGISPEDIEILQSHPEFCLPSESLLDFETLIQDETPDEDAPDNEQDHVSAAEVSAVSIPAALFIECTYVTSRPRQT